MKALAVFHDHGSHILAPLLKSGFRHVFVVLLAEDYWVRIDGMSGVPVVDVVAGKDYDLAEFYRSEGMTAVVTETGDSPPIGPYALANCVGMTKMLLGIRKPFVLTPHGLYRYLRRSPC